MTTIRPGLRGLSTAALAPLTAAALASGLPLGAGAQEAPVEIPPPAVDAAEAGLATAVLGGGGFWGVQGLFQHVAGVTGAVSGYAGGQAATATYGWTSRGDTGHAEAVEVTYDPGVVSYGDLLQIFFSVAHDPTQLNVQGPDRGTQYRSALFPEDAEQARVARAYIAQLEAADIFEGSIVTTIGRTDAFFPAEAYHQDYLVRNPGSRYIQVNDLLKIEALAALFPDAYRAEPVLVGGS